MPFFERMQYTPPIKKYPPLMLLMLLPFAMGVLFYRCGAMLDLGFIIPCSALLLWLNYRMTDKTLHFILFQLYELALLLSCGWFSAQLYYHNVSNDAMSLAIGWLMTYAELIAFTVASVIAAVVKALRHRRSS